MAGSLPPVFSNPYQFAVYDRIEMDTWERRTHLETIDLFSSGVVGMEANDIDNSHPPALSLMPETRHDARIRPESEHGHQLPFATSTGQTSLWGMTPKTVLALVKQHLRFLQKLPKKDMEALENGTARIVFTVAPVARKERKVAVRR